MTKAIKERRDDGPGAAAAPPDQAFTPGVGTQMRQARKKRHLTLRQVAERAGVSASFLSQVETGRMAPTVATLKRIADVLELPAGALMFGQGPRGAAPVAVVRRDGRKRLSFPHSNIRYELLTPDLRRRTSLLWLTAPPGSESGQDAFSHEGEDGVIVLEGVLKVEVAGVWHALEAGDAIYFSSELPHRWRNDGEAAAQAVWVSTPPSF